MKGRGNAPVYVMFSAFKPHLVLGALAVDVLTVGSLAALPHGHGDGRSVVSRGGLAAPARPAAGVKLLLDEMWPPEVARQLRRHGYDVAAIAERPDRRGQPDAVIFAVAQREERAVVTENVVDYPQLAASEIHQGRRHHGVILTANRRFPRPDPGTPGHLVTALDRVLSSGTELANVEYWLS
jgi:predicted nuclease of predicted toxin-antitoxin system